MTDLEKAKALLEDGGFGNCILYSNGIIHTSRGKGISPILEFLEAGLDLKGFSAADTITGKALALLFVFSGIKDVYAHVMSRSAVEVFARHEIRCVYGELVDEIKNRAGDGVCPMERAVKNIDDPYRALEILKNALNAMRK
ncbi:MAG: DUF1893 domain-containing protein [Oscillospiraceae bacterium]|nr:DUF1893 domain-containing protein [Oscillospiraceae bacterium]